MRRSTQAMWVVLMALVFTIVVVTAWSVIKHAEQALWPAEDWLEVRHVYVPSGVRAGEPVPMSVNRKVHQPFLGAWQVTVRKWRTGWEVFCNASGTSNYRTDSELPESLDLHWWTDGGCPTLPPGKYLIDTTWRIDPGGLWSVRSLHVDSNTFEIVQ